MADKSANEADRFASGTGTTERKTAEKDSFRPGETGDNATILPGSGDEREGTTAVSADDTTGAAGEMDFTGAPAGTSGASDVSGASGAADSQGGGPGGGAMATGGTGPGTGGDAGPQSIESTVAVLGDRELSTGNDLAGVGGGASGAGSSDAAGDNAKTS